MRNSLVLVGLSGLAVGFAFMYASLHKPDVRAVTSGRLVASRSASTIEATLIAKAPPPADEARSAQLFERNRNMPADPDLAAEFEQINLDYFTPFEPFTAVAVILIVLVAIFSLILTGIERLLRLP